MASILCLAHYCDTHGPTPLMVTEGFTVACRSCHGEDDRRTERRPSTSHRSMKTPEIIREARPRVGRTQSSSSDKENDSQKTSQPHTPRLEHSSSALETPPDSPRLAAATLSLARISHRRDSSFRKTYDENDKKRAIPCENCALTLPKKVKEQIPEGAPGSPLNGGKADYGSPILRTRKAYERVSTAADDGSAKSTPSDSDESEKERPRILKRSTTSSSMSSFSSSNSQSHSHYLEYTSTHDPLSSASFSVLRASCLRTLSCETLPPNAAPTTPTSPSSYGPYKTSPNIGPSSSSTSGGPIFFGDPLAGYTTAYIFRVPDPYARGRRRVYAFICLSSANERTAMRAFAFLSAAFRDLASWIQDLAEAEADRLDGTSSTQSTHENSPTAGNTPASSLKQYSASARAPGAPGAAGGQDDSVKDKKITFTPTSSFLSGRLCDPDGYPRKGLMGSIRSRGLAELVGRADFFIELHARFVRLLAQLAVLFAGGAK